MASVVDAWTPSSLQLRFALGGANFRRLPPAVLVRTRLRKLHCRVRVLCVAQNGNGSDTGRSSGSWAGPDNGADSLSGWSESGNEREPEELWRKKWFGGIVGAGVIFAAGLRIAALAAGKRSTSRPKQEMEPLMVQQELCLVTDDQNVQGDEHDVDKHVNLENYDLEDETGIDRDSPSFPEKNKSGDDSVFFSIQNDGHGLTGTDASQSPQLEKLQEKADIDDDLVASTTGLSSELLLESEKIDSLVASENTNSYSSLGSSSFESNRIPKHNLSNDHTTDESLKNDVADHKEDGPLKDANSNSSYHSGDIDQFASDYAENTAEPQLVSEDDMSKIAVVVEEIHERGSTPEISFEGTSATMVVHDSGETRSFGTISMSAPANTLADEQFDNGHGATNESKSASESPNSSNMFSSSGIPAPSVVSEALRVIPGKVLVPPAVDQVQVQALAALQAMKVIENDVQAGDLCTRREYARWLVSASSALSRNTISKVYPAMYIENVTELAYDDITPEDLDFVFIQGLAEAGLISSKLSRKDMLSSAVEDDGPYCFFPESPLSRQDLVSWKMALEKRELPEADRKVLHQLSGFIDVDKIHPDACPALVADLSSGEQGVIALAFGYTKLFQPDKPVTKAQAAIALATGEAADVVSEELARIEAESMAENAVAAHTALVAQVEKEINANFEKVLSTEREKIDAVEKMAEEARHELEKLRAKREEDGIALMKERAAVESEMELLSRLRRQVEEQLESLMSNKVEISYEKEKVEKLRMDAEKETLEITRLQYELEVERKALSMARAWAEDEAKRAREHAKALEEARDRWERQGIKVVVDTDLQEEASGGDTWVNAAKEYSVEGTVSRAKTLMDKLRDLGTTVVGKLKEVINKIVNIISVFISKLKERYRDALSRAEELKDVTAVKASRSVEELKHRVGDVNQNLRDGAKRLAGDCRGGVEKLTQKFKT